MDYRNYDQKYDMAKLDRRRMVLAKIFNIAFNIFVAVGVIGSIMFACRAIHLVL